ncbi:hypothetical protein SANTM175S_02136 [Streptomyces antimycoticus]
MIGLTESRPGIRRRLERFFPEKFGTPGLTSPHGIRWLLRQNANWLRIYWGDVRPAVRARRRRRRDDLISHLLDEGCSAGEVLAECITFAAAGMVTTREFVNVAAWHLFGDAALLARYRAADEPGRIAILQEILRLEPVIGRLRRRTTAPLRLPGDGQDPGAEVTVPAGSWSMSCSTRPISTAVRWASGRKLPPPGAPDGRGRRCAGAVLRGRCAQMPRSRHRAPGDGRLPLPAVRPARHPYGVPAQGRLQGRDREL